MLADPTGSSLFHRVKHGVCYTNQQSEKTVKKHRYDSIVEGVGLDRLTANFNLAVIDDAERINDQEIIDTARLKFAVNLSRPTPSTILSYLCFFTVFSDC